MKKSTKHTNACVISKQYLSVMLAEPDFVLFFVYLKGYLNRTKILCFDFSATISKLENKVKSSCCEWILLVYIFKKQLFAKKLSLLIIS